jgi:formylglycine-generating enzyme required for sulfatase activity
MLAFIASVIATIGLVGAALAQKRVALVIGNSAYKYAGELPNPKNDAADISAVFRKLGFQVVDGIDLDKTAFDRKVRDFATALQGAEVGVFFYAGHGMQVGGQNYLVPIDAELSSEAALDFEMVRLDLVHRSMERETQTNIIFLDACRNNPLERSLRRAMGTRSAAIGRGLAAVESGIGSLISFSTQPGNVAADGTGRNSPFASALVRHLSDPDDLGAILIAVRNDVMQATQRQQVPWEHSALTGRFYFSRTVASDPVKVGPGRQSEAAEAWAAVKDSTNVAVLAAYIARYKETFYAELARARINDLKAQVAAKTEPTPKAKSPEPVEQKTALVETPAQKPPSPTRPAKPLTENETRALKAKDTFKECDECPEVVVVPAGQFLMGSPGDEQGRRDDEGPRHKVAIANAFALGKFEVTFAEWDACIAAGGCKNKPGNHGWGGGKLPVFFVSWNDVTKEYLPWLSRKTGKTYRLPTEAEWEYAARAGTMTPFSTGTTITTERANFNGHYTYGNSAPSIFRQKVVEVGAFPASAFGLYDMHGNVWEWVEDCYKESYAGASLDGAAVASGDCSNRVLRGGSWSANPQMVRSANRYWRPPDSRDDYFGFRVARTLGP